MTGRRLGGTAVPWWLVLAVRARRASVGLTALALAVGVVAATVVAGFAPLLSVTESEAARSILAAVPPDRLRLTVDAAQLSTSAADFRARMVAGGARIYGPTRLDVASLAVTGLESVPGRVAPPPADSPPLGTSAYFGELTGASIRVVRGGEPRSVASGPMPVLVPEASVAPLGLAVGDTVRIGSVDTVIAGTYRPRDADDAVWTTDPLRGSGEDGLFQDPAVEFYRPVTAFGPVLAAPGALAARDVAVSAMQVSLTPRFGPLTPERLTGLRGRLDRADDLLVTASAGAAGRLDVDTAASSATISSLLGALAVTRSIVVMLALLIAAVAAVAIVQIGRRLAAVGRASRMLQSARGASPGQLAALDALPAIGIALVAGVSSPVLAGLLVRLLAGLPGLRSTRIPDELVVTPASWVVGAASAVLLIVALLGSATAPSGSFAAALRDRARPETRSSVLRLATEVVVALLAVVALWQLDRYAGRPSAAGVDPVVVAAPVLVLAAGALLAGRIVRLLAVPLERAGRLARSAGAGLVLLDLARRRAEIATAAAVVAMTAAVAVFGAGYLATWSSSQQDQARMALGADARIGVAEDPLTQARRLAAAGAAVSPALRGAGPLGVAAAGDDASTITRVQLLGVTAAARRAEADGPLGPSGGRTIAALLDDAPDAAGPTLATGAARVRMRVTATVPGAIVDRISVRLEAVLETPGGLISTTDLGDAILDGAPHELRSEVLSAPRGTRLAALQVRVASGPLPPGEPSTAQPLELGVVPLDVTGSAARAWSLRGDAERTDAVDAGPDGEQVLRTSIPAGIESRPVDYSMVSWRPVDEVPVVVPSALARRAGLQFGSTSEVSFRGIPVPVRVQGRVAHVPGSTSPDDLDAIRLGLGGTSALPTVVADERTLARLLVQSGARGALTDEWWSSSARGVGRSSGVATWTADGLGRSLREGPSRIAIPVATALAVGCCLLLGLLAATMRIVAALRDRRLDRAQLRAIGVDERLMRAATAVEFGATALVGALLGAALGLAMTGLIAPRATLTALGTAPVPAALTVLPPITIALVPAVLVLVSILAALGAGRERAVAAVLRSGDPG